MHTTCIWTNHIVFGFLRLPNCYWSEWSDGLRLAVPDVRCLAQLLNLLVDMMVKLWVTRKEWREESRKWWFRDYLEPPFAIETIIIFCASTMYLLRYQCTFFLTFQNVEFIFWQILLHLFCWINLKLRIRQKKGKETKVSNPHHCSVLYDCISFYHTH